MLRILMGSAPIKMKAYFNQLHVLTTSELHLQLYQPLDLFEVNHAHFHFLGHTESC